MSHDKSHLSRAVDLEAHMEKKRQLDEINARWKRWSDQMSYLTSTWGYDHKRESEHDRDVREYVTGIITHDEYERREGLRLEREAVFPTIGTAA